MSYFRKPEVLKNVRNSSEIIAAYLIANGLSHDIKFLREIVFEKWLGLNDVSERELGSILGASNPNALTNSLADLISVRAQLGWATHGHSAVDVNLVCLNIKIPHLFSMRMALIHIYLLEIMKIQILDFNLYKIIQQVLTTQRLDIIHCKIIQQDFITQLLVLKHYYLIQQVMVIQLLVVNH